MQRRAAAVYFALFVVLGAGAYGFIQVGVTEPTVDLGPEDLSKGDTLTVDGQTYTVSKLGRAESSGGGGHGGGGQAPITGQLTWTNESAMTTATLDNASTTTYQGDTYNVSIENRTDVSEFTLVEERNVTAILMDDPAVENETGTIGDTTYVFLTAGGRQPLSEYLPEPETRGPFAEGDSYRYTTDGSNVTATVRDVSPSAATLAWNEPAENTIELSEGTNITLNGVEHFVHFTGENAVEILPKDQYYGEYQRQLSVHDAWGERVAGLWGIVIISLLAAIILLSAAYMPVKS